MNAGDFILVAAVAVFAILAVAGVLKWLIRALVGAAVGVAVLLAILHAPPTRWTQPVRSRLQDSRLVAVLRDRSHALLRPWLGPVTPDSTGASVD